MKSFAKNALRCALVLFVAAAGLLAMAACSDPSFNTQGQGNVRLVFKDNPARTALPDDWKLENFAWFDVSFTPESGGTGTALNVSISQADLALGSNIYDFTLDTGSYELEVIAYKTTDNTQPQASFSRISPLIVIGVGGAVTPVSVVLEAIVDGVEPGTFSYSIDIESEVKDDDAEILEVVLDITRLGGGVAANSPGDITGDISYVLGGDRPYNDLKDDNISLDSGYYYVDVSIKVKDGGATGEEETFYARHILHIYPFENSHFDFVFWYDGKEGKIELEGIARTSWSLKNLNTPPLITVDGAAKDDGDMVSLDIDKEETATITVSNLIVFDTVTYYFNALGTAGSSGEISSTSPFVIDTTEAPYKDLKGVYTLTVVGFVGGVPSSSYIYVRIWDSASTPGGGGSRTLLDAAGLYPTTGFSIDAFGDTVGTETLLALVLAADDAAYLEFEFDGVADGWHFAKWNIDLDGTPEPYEDVIGDDVSTTYRVTLGEIRALAAAGGGGTITKINFDVWGTTAENIVAVYLVEP